MEAPVQQRLHLRINMRFHRLEKEPVQLSALAFGESMPERFKLPAFLIGDVGFASDHRRNHDRKQRPGFPPLMRQVGLDQRAETPDHHLVANSKNDRPVIGMSFNERRETRRAEVPRQQRVIHTFRAVRQFLARSGLGHFERDCSIGPNLANGAPDRLLRSDIGRMILATVDHGNARLSAHKSVEDLLADRGHAGHAQCFVHNRRNDGHRLSSTDHRIAKLIRVHSHKVGAIYNNCTSGSMLNVQLDPHSCCRGHSENRC